MSYNYNNKKTVLVLSSSLEPAIALNVVGHLSIALGAYIDNDELMGRKELLDKSGVKHIGISKYPVIATKLKPSKMKTLIDNVKENYPDIFVVDYPSAMLTTGHDDELSEVLSNIETVDIDYYGVLLYGEMSKINELTGKFSLWK